MTLQQLEYVIALANHRNFVKAAESCFVTQPTLTMQVAKLEDEIGFLIYDRTKKPLRPTKLGDDFINKARKIIDDVNDLKWSVSNEKETIAGTYKLAIIPTLATTILPILLPGFNRDFPEVFLIVEELQSESIIDGLKNNSIDIGIMATPTNEAWIQEYIMFYEPFLAYYNKDNAAGDKRKIALNEMDINKMLLLSEGHCFRNQMLNLCNNKKSNSQFHFEYQSGSIETLKALVDKDMGFTLVPELSVLCEIKTANHIKRFKAPEPVREVSIITHQNFHKYSLIDEMRKKILSGIPATFSKNENYQRIEWR